MIAPDSLVQLATDLGLLAQSQRKMIVTAESCTGGLIAWALTQTAGSSAWFERGFVTYSNAAKEQSIGVPSELIAAHGAVSETVALAMAQGALNTVANAQLALSVTGIAGPSGGSPDKPVGTVCFAWAVRQDGQQPSIHTTVQTRVFEGDRAQIRERAAQHAIAQAIALLSTNRPSSATK